jgi:hypothetical protein
LTLVAPGTPDWWRGGLAATIEVLGGFPAGRDEAYRVEVLGSDGTALANAPMDGDPRVELGYDRTMRALLQMCERREMPVPLLETAMVIRPLLAGRQSAAPNQVVTL